MRLGKPILTKCIRIGLWSSIRIVMAKRETLPPHPKYKRKSH
jgi:hypothetical protein